MESISLSLRGNSATIGCYVKLCSIIQKRVIPLHSIILLPTCRNLLQRTNTHSSTSISPSSRLIGIMIRNSPTQQTLSIQNWTHLHLRSNSAFSKSSVIKCRNVQCFQNRFPAPLRSGDAQCRCSARIGYHFCQVLQQVDSLCCSFGSVCVVTP